MLRNNGGGHYNHSFFWKVLGAPGSNNGPSADLKAAIDESFGSLDELKTKFNGAAAGRFGSGWAWVVLKDNKLVVTDTPNQDNPLMSALAPVSGVPILGLDVWEHVRGLLSHCLSNPTQQHSCLCHLHWSTVPLCLCMSSAHFGCI